MSFIAECVQDSLPIWQQCLDSDFLTGMEQGTLDPKCFAGYIVDDSLYLREYAKVFAAGIVQAKTLAEIRTYYSFLEFVNEGEGNTRVEYLHRMGLSDEALEAYEQRPQNRAYTDFMIRATQQGTTGAECMMAGLPCMISYAWLFHRMVERSPQVLEGPYGQMIRDYVVPSADAICVEWVDFANRLCEHLTPEEKQQNLQIFRQSSLHELEFWKMSSSPRTDLIL